MSKKTIELEERSTTTDDRWADLLVNDTKVFSRKATYIVKFENYDLRNAYFIPEDRITLKYYNKLKEKAKDNEDFHLIKIKGSRLAKAVSQGVLNELQKEVD